jgi:8-oxo-dGTP diphosphatase
VTARFCLACGARLRTVLVEGRRRRRCPRCGWTWYANPVPAAVGLIVHRGRVLLARRARPPYANTWDLPGGFLEGGETPEAGLRRELREEIGVGVRASSLIGFATDRYGPRGFAILTTVHRVTPTTQHAHAADDVAEVRWFPLDEIPYREIAFAGLRRLIHGYLQRRARHERP